MSAETDPLLDILDDYNRRLEARKARRAREGITPEEDLRRFIEGFLNPPLTDEEKAMQAAGLLDPDDIEREIQEWEAQGQQDTLFGDES